MRSLLALLCLFPIMALSQGAKYSDYTIDSNGHPLAGVQVRVCATSSPSTPPPTSACTPLATLYTDETLILPSVNPVTSDMAGNFSFFAPTGFYILQFYQNGIQTFAQTIQVGTTTTNTVFNATVGFQIGGSFGSNGQCITSTGTGSAWGTCGGGGGGGGITTLNPGTLTGPTVTLATDAAGTDFGVAGAANVITFSLPTASATNRGALSSADWSTFNTKQAAISVTPPITLAGASIGIVNQGTATTVLHGNVSGSASFAAVTSADTTGTFAATAHNLLSATHGDTTTHAVVRGDLVAGIGAVPSWTAVAKGGTNTYPKWNASGDVIPSTLAAAGVGTPTACTNQFVTSVTLNADAAPTTACTTDTLASVQHANQGSTTTVLHGNASGAPTWGAVTSADTTGTFAPSAHNLLSTSHGDTTAAAATVGALITGQTGPVWASLAPNATATKKYLQSVSSGAASWQQIAYADLSSPPTLFYQTMQNSGSNLAQEPKLNLTGAGVTCADNAGLSTDCTIPGGGGSNQAGATLFSTTTLTGPSNTGTETSLLSTSGISGTKTIPANTFSNGTVMQVQLSGFYSTPAVTVDNLTLRVKCGTTVLASKVVSGLVVAATNQAARLYFDVHAIGTGASGSLLINTIAEFTGTTLTPSEASIVNTSAVAYDFTTSCAFDVTAQWAAAQAGESISAVGAAWVPGAPVFSVNGLTGAVSVGTVTSIATTGPITGGTINTTGTIACPTCTTATTPGIGIAHFAGGTQNLTSSAIAQGDVTGGYMDLTTNQTAAGIKTFSGSVILSLLDKVVYAAGYGMVCDGVTVDDTALQNAIVAAGQNGTVIIPPGTCENATNIQVYDGQTIKGAGKLSTIIQRKTGANSATNVFIIGAGGGGGTVGNVIFQDFTIDGNQAGQTTADSLISGTTVAKVSIVHMRFINSYNHAIRFAPAAGQNAADILISQNDFENNGTRAGCAGVAVCNDIRVNNPLRLRVISNRSDGAQNFFLSAPTAPTNGYIDILDNIVNNCLGFAAALGGAQTNATISRNTFYCPTSTQNIVDIATANNTVISDNNITMGTVWSGIADAPPATQVTVTGNTIVGNTGGPGTANCVALGGSDLTITGNVCTNAGGAGISIAVGNANTARSVVVNGNVAKNNSRASAGAHAGIELFLQTGGTAALQTAIIANNSAYDDQGVKTQGWGIGLAAAGQVTGFSSITVTNNDVRGNLTAGIKNNINPLTNVQIYSNPGGEAAVVGTPTFAGLIGATPNAGYQDVFTIAAGGNAATDAGALLFTTQNGTALTRMTASGDGNVNLPVLTALNVCAGQTGAPCTSPLQLKVKGSGAGVALGGNGTGGAALNLTSQTAPTTPVAGDIWRDANGFLFVDATSTQGSVCPYNSAGTFSNCLTSAPTANRTTTFPDNTGTVAEGNIDNAFTATQTFNQPANKAGQASIVAASAAINTTETIIVKTPALTASRLVAGTVLRMVLVGTCTSTVANVSTIALRYGTLGTTGDALLATGTVTAAASGTTVPFKIIIDLTVRTTGASATGFATYEIDNNGTTGIAAVNTTLVNPTMSAFNTTTANAIISVTYKTAATTTTSTFQQAWIEVVYQ